MRFLATSLTCLSVLALGLVARAEMSSTNYSIGWDSLSQGGMDTASSASYTLRDTIGNVGAGESSSASYDLRAGYRQGVFDQVIAFDVFAQDVTTARTPSALSGNVVTVDPTNIDVGDFIAVVQDLGASQVSAIGQVTATSGTTVTVDAWKNGGTVPVIDGTNDYVYVLGSMSINLQNLQASVVQTGIVGFEVSADVVNGYTVQVFEDGALRTPGALSIIADVSDGSVTAGQEEYGGRSSDTSISSSTFDTADTSFGTLVQKVADENEATFDSRNFVTIKASISSSTDEGIYSHFLSFIASGNF